jgi:hypothetical protein
VANRLQRGVEWLSKRHGQAAALASIIYVRASEFDGGSGQPDSVTLYNVTAGNYAFRIEDRFLPGNSRVEWSDRDYLIPRNKLLISSVLVEPARGDYILETLPSGTYKFELYAPNDEQVWRWSEPEQVTYRIHTRKVLA